MSVPAPSRPTLLSAAAPASFAPVGGITGNADVAMGALGGGMGLGATNSTTFFGMNTDNQTLSSHTNAPLIANRKQYLQHKSSELERIYDGEYVFMCPPIQQRRIGGSMSLPTYPRAGSVIPMAPVNSTAYRSWSAVNKILYEHPLEYNTRSKILRAFKPDGVCLKVAINPEESSQVNDFQFTVVKRGAQLGMLGYAHQFPDTKPGDKLCADLVRFERSVETGSKRSFEVAASAASATVSPASQRPRTYGSGVSGYRSDTKKTKPKTTTAAKAAGVTPEDIKKEYALEAQAESGPVQMTGVAAQQDEPSKKKKKRANGAAAAVQEAQDIASKQGLNTAGLEAAMPMDKPAVLVAAEETARYYWQFVPVVVSVKHTPPMPGNVAEGWRGERLVLGTVHSVTQGSASFANVTSFVQPKKNNAWISYAPYIGKTGLLVNGSV